MEYQIVESQDIVTIIANGPIEMRSIKDFKDKLLEMGDSTDKNIEIDLSHVDYMDSTGIGLLITLLKKQKKKDKQLRIVNATPRVLSLLELSSLSEVLS
ncbi:MAG TPA: STAS domain-containing protein [Spirochaetota bacterium]|nr:STAS domain-containing protein [Spirochaetota bacterium]HNT10622.1 STAS domain-containing protein [Spirochaetota bacterium]HNV48315.1 STAS domain-containing protein [Spirochaetota bacterium]HOS40190.1 STAS domain-containing protein [Spirochaetota bacterium]HPU90003.1 STAS domain-containing protein [Spirochaetota bacterium]